MQDYLALVGGVACAALGGDLFVRSAVGLALALRVSAATIGATIAAFATSSPELRGAKPSSSTRTASCLPPCCGGSAVS